MKITIDTKEDSPEEIKKTVDFLKTLVGEREIISNQGNIFSDDSSEQSGSETSGEENNAFLNMFGSSSSSDPEPSGSSGIDNTESPDAEEDPKHPKVMEYL
ncbi:hypothetical protein GF351_03225 [Candidatus Woesearchaeota archaeon]|nr:hypothetical protein [Candidatus Woesearchaeota archaeon]